MTPNSSPALSFNTTDTTSPISGYTISIDSGAIIDAGPLKRGNVYCACAFAGKPFILVRIRCARNYTDGLLS